MKSEIWFEIWGLWRLGRSTLAFRRDRNAGGHVGERMFLDVVNYVAGTSEWAWARRLFLLSCFFLLFFFIDVIMRASFQLLIFSFCLIIFIPPSLALLACWDEPGGKELLFSRWRCRLVERWEFFCFVLFHRPASTFRSVRGPEINRTSAFSFRVINSHSPVLERDDWMVSPAWKNNS